MNSMTSAMATAGIQLPSKMECMWKIVKDHPNLSSSALALKAKVAPTTACALLYQLQERGMVTSTLQVQRRRTGRGMASREVKIYTVARGMDKYELLPMPAAKSKTPAAPLTLPRQVAAPVPAVPSFLAEAKPAVPKMTQTFAEVFMMNHSTIIQTLHKIDPSVDLYSLKVSDLLQICAKHGVKINFS